MRNRLPSWAEDLRIGGILRSRTQCRFPTDLFGVDILNNAQSYEPNFRYFTGTAKQSVQFTEVFPYMWKRRDYNITQLDMKTVQLFSLRL